MSIFIRREGIVGEGSDKGLDGCIDVKSISWGVDRKISSKSSTQGDRESSNAVITDLFIKRNMDKASPTLFIESCCGIGKDLIVYLTKTGAGQGSDVFMEYTLKNAIISHYQVEAEASDTERPVEKLRVSFIEIDIRYTAYDENGIALAPQAVGFNTSTNIKK